MIIFLWVFAAVCFLLLAALALPVRVECRASVGEVLHYRVGLRTLGGLGPRVALADSDKPSRKKAKPKEKKFRKDKSKRREAARILPAAMRLVNDIFGRLHVEKLALDVRFGADDPADTGQIYGSIAPVIYGTAGCRSLQLNVRPVFDGAVFDGHAALDVRFTPLRLIPPFVRFGWSALGPHR